MRALREGNTNGMNTVDAADPRLGRMALRRELVAEGWTDAALRRALRDGTLVRPRHGAYVEARIWDALDARGRHEIIARSVLARAGAPAVLSHSSALAVWDAPTWGLDLQNVHLTRLDERAGRVEAGVHQHRGVVLEGDTASVRGVPVTSPSRAVLETATLLTTEQALVQFNDLLHRRLASIEGLASRFASMRAWPGSATTDLALRLSDDRIESVAESRFYYLCWRQGLPAPVPQYEVYDARGRLVAVLDFAWPARGLFVEIDGMIKYVKPLREGETAAEVVLREKKREDLARKLTSFHCLRFTWPDLSRPEATAAEVRAYLGDAPAPRGRAA